MLIHCISLIDRFIGWLIDWIERHCASPYRRSCSLMKCLPRSLKRARPAQWARSRRGRRLPWTQIETLQFTVARQCVCVSACVHFGYLEEILDVLTAIERRDISGELQQVLRALSSFLNYRVIKTPCTGTRGETDTHCWRKSLKSSSEVAVVVRV